MRRLCVSVFCAVRLSAARARPGVPPCVRRLFSLFAALCVAVFAAAVRVSGPPSGPGGPGGPVLRRPAAPGRRRLRRHFLVMPGVRVSLSAGTGSGFVRTNPVLETIETSEAF